MKAVDFNQPELLLEVFAKSGTRNTLPVLNTDASNPQLADLTNGFPIATQGSPDDGKLPPERADFNALGFLTTSYDYFYQAGGTFTFNSTIATAIGGYPKGSRLWYTNASGLSMILRSTKDDNTDNFITTPSFIGNSWVVESMAGIDNTSVSILDYKFSDKVLNKMAWILSDNNWVSGSTYLSAYQHLVDDVGFVVRNDSGTVKIGVSCSSYTAGDYVRSSTDDLTISGTSYYAWKNSTDILYLTLNTDSMTSDSAVSSLQGQRIYKYENSEMFLTIHRISISTTDSYTINGNTVSLNVLVGSDGLRIVLYSNGEDSTLDTIYNSLSVAWYYLLDKTNSRFKLPRTKYGFNGFRDTVGKYIEESLPNIRGTLAVSHTLYTPDTYDGAFSDVLNYANNNLQNGNDTTHHRTIAFNATNSSSVYKDNAPVQERGTQMYLYFYVGDFSDTAIQQTAGINAETLNSKMDNDISNASATGKSAIAKQAMPSGVYDDLTLGASGASYTAPANGYVSFCKQSSGASQNVNIKANGIMDICWANASLEDLSVFVPVKSGDTFTVEYTAGNATQWFRFVYAEGENNV